MNFRNSSNKALSRMTRWCKVALLGAAFALVGTANAQVSVTATAGTMGPTAYTTVNAAFTAINAGTHQGAVTVTVTANTTEPSTPVPLLRSNAPSSYSSVLITCTGNVTINSAATPTATRGILEFVGADNVTIDGDDPGTSGTRNLTIQMATTTNSATHCIRLASNSTTGLDGADNNTVKNCNIIGGRNSATTTTSSFGILMSNSTVSTGGAYSSLNTVIDNNAITRCYVGVSANGVSATYLNSGTIIRNNIMGSATSAENIGQRGILISYSASTAGVGSALIQNNDIRAGDYSTTGFATSVAGIEVGTVNAGCIIERNNIHDVYQQNIGGYHALGIYITGSTSNSGVTIRNNFIRDMVSSLYTTSVTTIGDTYGIYFSAGATNVNIDHNTIRLSINPTVGTTTNHINACVAASVSGVTIASFRNNILVNTLSSTNSYGLYCNTTTNISGGLVNNNDYYVPSGKVGYYNAAARTTLADWQTATSKDGASISLNGPFVSATNLHVNLSDPNASAFNGTGATGTGVTNDYDGDTRGTPPDIGADEFILTICSAANGGTITPGTASACAGGTYAMSSVGAEVGAGISYQWEVSTVGGGVGFGIVSGGIGANSTNYTTGALTAGTYYYRLNVTCSSGPVTGYSNELTLTVNPIPSASASNNGPACVGGSVNLSGTSDIGTSFSWAGPVSFSATSASTSRSSLLLTHAGTYTFTASAGGCTSAPATTAVVVNPAPVISSTTATPNPTCFNGNSQLQVNVAGPGAYCASTHTSGCSTDAITNVVLNTLSNPTGCTGVNSGYTDYTAGPTTTLNVSGNPFTVNVSFGSDGNQYFGAWIDYDQSGTFEASEFLGASGNAGSNGTIGVSFSIPGTAFNGATRLRIVGGNDSPVTATQPCGASSSNYGETEDYKVTITGATDKYTYSWSPATFLSSTTIANPMAMAVNAPSTAYTVTVLLAGCPSTGNVTLTTSAPITAATITGTPTFCAGGSTTLTAVPTDGAGPFTYAWTGPGGPAGTNAAQNITVGGSWSVLVSDACGGSVNSSISVTANALPAPVITPGGPVSFCDSGMLSSNIATGNVWSPGGATTQTINATVSGSYSVTVTDGNGCIGTSASVAVTVTASPTGVTANASDLLVCDGATVDLTSTGSVIGSSTVLTENFNGAAAGWTTVNNSTGGTPANTAWTLRPNSFAPGGSWSGSLNSNDASQFYFSNNDAGGSGNQTNTELISPSMDLSGYSTASLSFWHYYRDGSTTAGVDQAIVEVSVNGGSWNPLQTYTTTQGAQAGFVNANISLNAQAGQPNVRIRFHYVTTAWWWGWAVDNVTVTGTALPTFSWASNPVYYTNGTQNPTGVSVSPVPTTFIVTVTNPVGGCTGTASVTVNPDNTDTDNDGIIDCLDNCPNLPGQIGDVCDANPGPGFTFGQINGSCACVAVPCTENVTVDLRTDAKSDEAGWEILLQNSAQVVCKGGFPDTPYPANIMNPITDNCCLPVGCYRLRVLDSAGDGFTSGGFTGGYQLRESGVNGRRIIDNFENFTTGSVSALANTYDNGAFCVPLGNVELIYSSCDKLDWVSNKYMVCHADPAVSAVWVPNGANSVQSGGTGYAFWIFDPNGTYSYRRFRAHNASDGFSPASATRACHMKVNGWNNTGLTPHIPEGVLMNVRVRPVVMGSLGDWGPACKMKLDAVRAACPLVNLQDDPANTSDYSCGVTRSFGGSNSNANKIVADPPQFQPAPLAGGTGLRYQFRFRIEAEGVCIVRPMQTSPTMYLNWNANSGPQLQASKTYEVEVRVSKDQGATWCVDAPSPACDPSPVTHWGKACNVTISNVVMIDGGSSSIATQGNGSFTMYPNPNRGDQLFINLTNVGADVNTASVDIYDLTGKRVSARTIAVQDGIVNSTLQLNGDLAGGVYLVNITAGTKTHTERLVIQP